ncbi:DUF262 domain-containing protein [Stakelama saccharophila]|uniref:DUF262 domain-containing protein n=1 Tax=Stakelama saccharophila TaxID=3075605 RepID=A0ABZ0BCE1_9SPHN|nr:DUF262 domain-containing protein [Stakelama sp. W311]WNO54949.1 DUF262 domain-containing protein [Stakelama sp. W311]
MDAIENNEIRTEAVDFSFGELLNLHKDGEIVIRPEYQRLFRWSNEQRSRLIESILLKLPIPPIFLIEDNEGVLELIDGLQRTSSVIQFMDHDAIEEPELILEGCDILDDLNGMKFEDFATSIRLGLKRTPIRAIIIKKSGSDFVKYEMFKRLNTGGSLLAPQEIRNCSCRMISGGADFYTRLQSLASHSGFVTATNRIPETDREQRADEELVLRFFAVEQYRDHFSGNVREWLDAYMEEILFEEDQSHIFNEDHFRYFFDFIADKFGDSAFSRWRDGSATGRLAPAYFEAVCGALSPRFKELTDRSPEDLQATLNNAFEDEEFRDATGPGANSKMKMEARIEVVGKHFFPE